MAQLDINYSITNNMLKQVLDVTELQPGDDVSYQACKTIYVFHPFGAKMAEAPITMAQHMPREVSVAAAPDMVATRFVDTWEDIGATKKIHTLGTTARIYGVATLGVLADGIATDQPLTADIITRHKLAFNIWDPLNTAGSLVINQDPNSMDFQKSAGVAVGGVPYHRSRTISLMNEAPVYIQYTSSGFGYVGRSVYLRALYPLQSFIKTMVADDMIATKSGVIVAKMKQAGSVINQAMSALFAQKRDVVKQARTGNVISVGEGEEIESLDMKNLEGPLALAKTNIRENCALAAGMPAKILNQETFAIGFGEGSEDAKHIAQYIDTVREWLQPAYEFFDKIVMRLAWDEAFFATVQAQFPEQYGNKTYNDAFYEWESAFKAAWPNLLKEPESEAVKTEETKFKAAINLAITLMPILDPQNKARLTSWLQDTFNEQKLLFPHPLNLDEESLVEFLGRADQMQMQETVAETVSPESVKLKYGFQ